MRTSRPGGFATSWLLVALLSVSHVTTASAETGYDAWLRYAPLDPAARDRYASLPRQIVSLGDSPVLRNARDEVVRGLTSMLGAPVTAPVTRGRDPVVLLGVLPRVRDVLKDTAIPTQIGADGFWLGTLATRQGAIVVVAGGSERGVLYGAFALLRRIGAHEDVTRLNV